MTQHLDDAAAPDLVPAGGANAPARMWRAAWRQHRTWVLWCLALVATGGAALALVAAVVQPCAAGAYTGNTCGPPVGEVVWRLLTAAMVVGPPLVGVLLGAVTFGPDVEHRTQVYALTQGIGRVRWWAVKSSVTAAPVFLAAAVLGLAALWFVNSVDASGQGWAGKLTSPGFDMLGLTPATRFLVGFAAAATAALWWRTVGGIVAGLVISGIVLVSATLLQPFVVSHERALIPIQVWLEDNTGGLDGGPVPAYNWSGYADVDGTEIDFEGLDCGPLEWSECLVEKVTYRIESYVLDSQYLPMMLIINGINLLLSGVILGIGLRGLQTRDL